MSYEKENLETIEKLRNAILHDLAVYGNVYLTNSRDLYSFKDLDQIRSANEVISVQAENGKLRLVVLKSRYGKNRRNLMSGLVDFAMRELSAAGLFDTDSDYGGALGKAVIELIEVFSRQGHSGFSAGMVSNLFDKLSRYDPITPLTGKENEWVIVGNGLRQNNRCSHVFEQEGQAYDSHGKIFREPNGVCYTSKESRVPITFPYSPKSEYVDVPFQTEKDE